MDLEDSSGVLPPAPIPIRAGLRAHPETMVALESSHLKLIVDVCLHGFPQGSAQLISKNSDNSSPQGRPWANRCPIQLLATWGHLPRMGHCDASQFFLFQMVKANTYRQSTEGFSHSVLPHTTL